MIVKNPEFSVEYCNDYILDIFGRYEGCSKLVVYLNEGLIILDKYEFTILNDVSMFIDKTTDVRIRHLAENWEETGWLTYKDFVLQACIWLYNMGERNLELSYYYNKATIISPGLGILAKCNECSPSNVFSLYYHNDLKAFALFREKSYQRFRADENNKHIVYLFRMTSLGRKFFNIEEEKKFEDLIKAFDQV